MLNSFATDLIDIYRPTVSYNTLGEKTQSLVSLYTNIRSSFQKSNGDNSIINNVNGIRANIRIYTDVISITENDIIRYSSIDYRITAITNMYNNHLELEVERIL